MMLTSNTAFVKLLQIVPPPSCGNPRGHFGLLDPFLSGPDNGNVMFDFHDLSNGKMTSNQRLTHDYILKVVEAISIE
jgi:hypothetical protein